MSVWNGKNLSISVFGQSHSDAVGVVIDGFPSGFSIDRGKLASFMKRRSPGTSLLSSSRAESDDVEFVSGFMGVQTCGAPICAIIRNNDARPEEYSNIRYVPRPSHADYPAYVKFGGHNDYRGGGQFSGRLTAPLCVAGGICLQYLEGLGVHINAHIYSLGNLNDIPFDPLSPQSVDTEFPTTSKESGKLMRKLIASVKADSDSVGGIIECAAVGLPVGLGDCLFDGIESALSASVFAIPAVKGIEFGAGFASSRLYGSEYNDKYCYDNGRIVTGSNNQGGISGGITNGMPIIFRAVFKPTPSIGKPQSTVNLKNGEEVKLTSHGRHDPCIVPRAVPVIEAVTAFTLADLLINNFEKRN